MLAFGDTKDENGKRTCDIFVGKRYSGEISWGSGLAGTVEFGHGSLGSRGIRISVADLRKLLSLYDEMRAAEKDGAKSAVGV